MGLGVGVAGARVVGAGDGCGAEVVGATGAGAGAVVAGITGAGAVLLGAAEGDAEPRGAAGVAKEGEEGMALVAATATPACAPRLAPADP